MQNSKKTVSSGETRIHFLLINKAVLSSSKHRNINSCIRIKGILVKSLYAMLVLALFAACNTTKPQVYFKTLPRDTVLSNVVTENYELKIMKTDVLGIAVASLSPDVAFYNNAVAGSNSGGAAGTSLSGYAVDTSGNISFVKVGLIHVAGLTRKQVKDTLERALVPYLRDVVVTVSFANRHVTMLGAVGTQVLPMITDNMTIFDALAASGDLAGKGKMDNVLIIREEKNTRVFKRFNLQEHAIFYSPYLYLQPNDIVYVEPAKIETPLTTPQVISYITAGASLIFLILNALKL